jgi:chromosome segregation ATPase
MQAHQQQVDEQVGIIENLHRQLQSESSKVAGAEAQRTRLEAERREVLSDVGVLEADMRRVRDQAESFGKDLAQLRHDKEQERLRSADQAQSAHSAKQEIAALQNELQLMQRRFAQKQAGVSAVIRTP